MNAFDYAAPRTVAEAVRLLAGQNGAARPVAGGTDLLVQLREGRKHAALVIDVKRIPELNVLTFDARGGLEIGAAVPCCRVAEHADVAKRYPGLVDAVSLVGGVQIQSRASIGGNLCNASPAADTIPALIAHQAACHVSGPGAATRQLAVEAFCVAPRRNALQPGELLTAISLPPPAPRSAGAYLRFIPRNEMDIAVVGVGVTVTLDDAGTCRAARVALGAVAPTPLLVPEAGATLVGTSLSDAAIDQAAALAQAAARPISDMRGDAAFRRHLVGVLVRRATRIAAARARES